MDNNFDKTLVLGSLQNRMVQRSFQQFGQDGENIDAHDFDVLIFFLQRYYKKVKSGRLSGLN